MPQKIKILLVEDDPNLSVVLSDYLALIGYEVELSCNGTEGLEQFKKQSFDLCILDVMLPGMDGFTLAKHIRDHNSDIALIFLTAKSLEQDRIKGFQMGCDDYITKPFSTEELNLRIKAILRRCLMSKPSHEMQGNAYRLGIYNFDTANLLLTSEFGKTRLTPKEAALLKILCEHKNRLLPRDTALKKVWGDTGYFAGRSMDVFITKLRKYLRDDPSISIINVHGMGFKLEILN
jgi:DNA-binding response OmpR family regulator